MASLLGAPRQRSSGLLGRRPSTRLYCCFLPLLCLTAVFVLHLGSVQLPLVPVENVIRRQHSCSDRLVSLGLRLDVLSSENRPSPAAARHKLYDSMASSLLRNGLSLGAMNNTQGHGLSDLFVQTGGLLLPKLHRLDVPVRAFVAPLANDIVSRKLLSAVQCNVLPLVPQDGAWLQDPRFYHSTIFHASTHTNPVPALASVIDAEAGAVLRALSPLCPVRAVLERVAATSGGVLMACWQVLPGSTEPRRVRQVLREALPDAPREQIVTDHDILHTTLARVVVDPGPEPGTNKTGAVRLAAAAAAMTRELCGLEVTFDRLWFAEEHDMLALALGGAFDKRVIPLACDGKVA